MGAKYSSFLDDVRNIPGDISRGVGTAKGIVYLALLAWIGNDFIANVFYSPVEAQYGVFFSIIGLCCTFAALSFGGSRASEDKVKIHLRNAGYDLFAAGLHGTKALLLRYIFDILRRQTFWENMRLATFIADHHYIQRTALTITYIAATIFIALSISLIVPAINEINAAFKNKLTGPGPAEKGKPR